MRWAVTGALAFAAASACEKAKRDDAPPVRPTSAAVVADAQLAMPDAVVFTGDVAAICATTKQLVERAMRCAPGNAELLKETRRSLDHDETPPDAPVNAHERWAAICAGIAKAYDGELAGRAPACAMTADERARNDLFLAAYYGRRTKPRPTGVATIDKTLADLAAARDRLCACPDEECVRAAHKVFDAAVKPIDPPQLKPMEDAVAITEEVSRCADRIEQDAARARR